MWPTSSGTGANFDEMAEALRSESEARRNAEQALEKLKAASRAEIVRLRAAVEDLQGKLEVRHTHTHTHTHTHNTASHRAEVLCFHQEAPFAPRNHDTESVMGLKEIQRVRDVGT